MAGQVGRAAEAARMQNYDQWKNLPSMVLFDKAKSYLQVGKIDSALVCFVIVSNRYDPKQSEPEKKIISAAAVGAGNIYTHNYYDYPTAFRFYLKGEKIALNRACRFRCSGNKSKGVSKITKCGISGRDAACRVIG